MGSFGNGVVTVFEIEVVGAFATVVVTFAAVVVGGVAPPIAGIGVVTVLASVVAGNVVNDNAAFFVFGVVISVSVGESEPPQALMASRAAAVRARAVARGEIFMQPIYSFVIANSRRPWSQPGGPQSHQHSRRFLRTASQTGFFAAVAGGEVTTGASVVFTEAVVVGANVVEVVVDVEVDVVADVDVVVDTTAAVVTQSSNSVVVVVGVNVVDVVFVKATVVGAAIVVAGILRLPTGFLPLLIEGLLGTVTAGFVAVIEV